MLERRDVLLLPKGAEASHPLFLARRHWHAREKKASGANAHRKWNQRVFVGHDHSAGIAGTVWRVGTSTPLTLPYVTSPATNWTNTHGVIYDNGQRQLIGIYRGKVVSATFGKMAKNRTENTAPTNDPSPDGHTEDRLRRGRLGRRLAQTLRGSNAIPVVYFQIKKSPRVRELRISFSRRKAGKDSRGHADGL